jgi:hypothetical protein
MGAFGNEEMEIGNEVTGLPVNYCGSAGSLAIVHVSNPEYPLLLSRVNPIILTSLRAVLNLRSVIGSTFANHPLKNLPRTAAGRLQRPALRRSEHGAWA